MHAQRLVRFLWFILLGTRALAATPEAHLSDPMSIATADHDWAAQQESRLAAFERETGIRIVVEFHTASPSAEEDTGPGVYMRARSTRFGLIENGILLVYFADEPDWRAWIGDNLAPRWVGRPGTAAEFTADDSMHDAKEAWLMEAFARVKSTLPPDSPSSQARATNRVRLETEALIDGIFKRLGGEVSRSPDGA